MSDDDDDDHHNDNGCEAVVGVDDDDEAPARTDRVDDAAASGAGGVDNDDNNDNSKKETLLELAELTMAQSMLVFLLADLRAMSSTGKVRTQYQDLAIDSDRFPKLTSRDYAGYNDRLPLDGGGGDNGERCCWGVTAVHVMAVLLTEITREADELQAEKRRKHDRQRGLQQRTYGPQQQQPPPQTPLQRNSSRQRSQQSLRGTTTSARDVVRDSVFAEASTSRHRSTTDLLFSREKVQSASSGMPALLHCYKDMIASDISGHIRKVRKSELFSATKKNNAKKNANGASPRTTASYSLAGRRRQQQRGEDGEGKDGRGDGSANRNVGGQGGVGSPGSLTEVGEENDEDDSYMVCGGDGGESWNELDDEDEMEQRLGLPPAQANFQPDVQDYRDEEKLLTDNRATTYLREKRTTFAEQLPNLRQSKNELALAEVVELQNQIFTEATDEDTNHDGYFSKRELMHVFEQSIKQRDSARLQFILEGFFKEGSICHILTQSKAEMVWLNDWHSTRECTYGISVDRERKRVLLAFRGAYTRADWSHAYDWTPTATSNPIMDQYEGRKPYIKLHGGIHRYLFRVRKDTGTTKYDEVVSKLQHYCRVVGPGVRVVVTGHSLGAALSTIFSLYASTNEHFIANGPIEAVTFGGPLVGGFAFADAVRYQERVGKLRIARFHNVKDGVPSLPPALFAMSKRGAVWFHNGLSLKLPMIRRGKFLKFLFGQPSPAVKYHAAPQSFLRSWLHQLRVWDTDVWRRAWLIFVIVAFPHSVYSFCHFLVKSFYFFNVPIRLWKFAEMHTLVEHKRRLSLIDKSKGAANNKNAKLSPLAEYSLEELYAMLEKFPCD